MHRNIMAYEESTRDPIFLFQTKRWIYQIDKLDSETNCDDDYIYTDKETGEVLDEHEMEKRELANSYWETQSVWYAREEARVYGSGRTYKFGKEGRDWRVYCVCCEGELSQLLDKQSDSRDMKVGEKWLDKKKKERGSQWRK